MSTHSLFEYLVSATSSTLIAAISEVASGQTWVVALFDTRHCVTHSLMAVGTFYIEFFPCSLCYVQLQDLLLRSRCVETYMTGQRLS